MATFARFLIVPNRRAQYASVMSDTDQITALQERLAHTTRQAEDLSEVVADQAKRIELLEKRVSSLLALARETSAQGEGSVQFGDQPPPHW